MWHESGHRAEVTCVARSPQKDTFAIGYADGSIRLWSASASSVVATFNGHKKSVTALAFDQAGARLASGSQDTDLILWDVVAEAGLFRYVLYVPFVQKITSDLFTDFEAIEIKLRPSSLLKLFLLRPPQPLLERLLVSLSPLQKIPSSSFGICQHSTVYKP